MTQAAMHDYYRQLQQDATRLAGGLTDLAQRATVYRHLYLASGRHHTFPLIAAHGALWAGGYFRRCLKLANWLSWQYVAQPKRRQEKLKSLAVFADVFRDINRRVCIDTYVNFHFTQRFGQSAGAREFVPSELLNALNQIHAACVDGKNLTEADRRSIFEKHFYHEQKNVVGPTLMDAVEKFDWPLVRWMALQPVIRFAYLPTGEKLVFRNFAKQEERITNGLKAFEYGSRVGWDAVEVALKKYELLPRSFFEAPIKHFEEMRTRILACGV